MKIVVADYESYFADDFTLSTMTTENYIRDRRFEAHGCAFYWPLEPDAPCFWVPRTELASYLVMIDWSDMMVIHHHAHFDSLISNHHYNVRPKLIGCTLSMARLMLGNHLSVSLDSVRRHFGIPSKTTPYNLFKGKRWHELAPDVQRLVGDGACDEVRSIWKVFCTFMEQGFPREELQVIDQTVRMFSEPCLGADVDMLARIWEAENKRKVTALQALADKYEMTVSELSSALASADRFAELLEREGVEPEEKDGKNGPIYAFAKSDSFMQNLLEDPDDSIKSLAEARIGAKSTAVQTRCETFGFMAGRGPLCLYLFMYGAHTTRWSGGDKANPQNLKRVDSRNRGASIREAIKPPEGFHLADPDLSQVECRVLHYLARDKEMLDGFRRGEDPYIKLATAAYGYEVTKAMPEERGTGKQLRLSCGYQAGAKTIQRTARLGTYGPSIVIDLPTATRWRNVYREQNKPVLTYWEEADSMLGHIAAGSHVQWGPFAIRNKRVYLPNGLFINYDTLEWHVPTQEEIERAEKRNRKRPEPGWRIKLRDGWSKLYPGKLTENVVSFAARVIASQAFLRIVALGYKIVNTEHDKHWVLIPKDGNEKHHLEAIRAEMIRTPEWLPGIPLDCDCKISA